MTVSRRGFLAGSAAGAAGLVIGFHVPQRARAAPAAAAPLPPANAFLRVGTDSSVTVVVAHSEMGQGTWTTMAMLLAEELDCDWSKIRAEHAPAAPVYAHPTRGIQFTGASGSTNGEFDRYRTVGATAKAMLLRAAASRWGTTPDKLRAANGVITSGARTLRYGEVAEAAMKLPPPKTVALKAREDWKLIGTKVRRIDTPEKITGKAGFGIDVAFPGLRTAVLLRPPRFGSSLVRFDDAAARAIPGVEQVVRTADGLAVIAKHFWAAKLGRDALRAEWTTPDGGGASTDAVMTELRALATRPGASVVDTADVAAARARAAKTIVAQYELPYLAHAPMEPLSCAVKIDGDRCEIWTGTQMQTAAQMAAARVLGTTPDKVAIHTTFLGGGFGRRGDPTAAYVREAVTVAKAAGVPVKVVWTREDDIRGGSYRPAFVHRVQASIDAAGRPTSWDHVVVGQSVLAGAGLAQVIEGGIDRTSVEGIPTSPYLDAPRAKRISLHSPTNPIPVLFWRSVGHSHTAFAVESMIDELARAAGKDPLAYRLALLAHAPRFARALETAAKHGGWGTPPPPGRARGLAVHESFGSIVGECAEVSVEGGRIRVHAVTAAIDCGTAVNPLTIEAQVQGSIVFGLTAALYGKITITGGQVIESNLHDYPLLRMHEMPRIGVHVLESDAPMGGVGEPATPPIAPAVANAVFALTGQRLRSLPLRLAQV